MTLVEFNYSRSKNSASKGTMELRNCKMTVARWLTNTPLRYSGMLKELVWLFLHDGIMAAQLKKWSQVRKMLNAMEYEYYEELSVWCLLDNTRYIPTAKDLRLGNVPDPNLIPYRELETCLTCGEPQHNTDVRRCLDFNLDCSNKSSAPICKCE